MNRFVLDRQAKFLILVTFLVASIASGRGIPFMTPWAADLHNVIAYAKCTNGASPYDIPGNVCGDRWGRPMLYPPLLNHMFVWTRPISEDAAKRIWALFQLGALAGVLWIWARRLTPQTRDGRDWELPIYGGLLLFQFPMLFALERGGEDAWSVVFVTIAALLLKARHFALAGAVFGFATAYKLYPGIACAVVALSLAIAGIRAPGWNERLRFLRFGASAVGVFALVFVLTWKHSVQYFTKVLPTFAFGFTGMDVYGHSIISNMAVDFALFGTLLFAGVVAFWVWASVRSLQRGDIAAPVAGALALCTYYQRHSWDYNLLTTYPLMMLMFLRARETDRWGVFALGLIALFGERQIFAQPGAALLTSALHVALQLAFLCCSAIVIATAPSPVPPAPAAEQAARA